MALAVFGTQIERVETDENGFFEEKGMDKILRNPSLSAPISINGAPKKSKPRFHQSSSLRARTLHMI